MNRNTPTHVPGNPTGARVYRISIQLDDLGTNAGTKDHIELIPEQDPREIKDDAVVFALSIKNEGMAIRAFEAALEHVTKFLLSRGVL